MATAYTCPQCGATSDNPAFSHEAIVSYHYPSARLWEGGPLVSDTSAPAEPHTDGWVSATDACACRFPSWEWDVQMLTYADGTAALVITRKAAG